MSQALLELGYTHEVWVATYNSRRLFKHVPSLHIGDCNSDALVSQFKASLSEIKNGNWKLNCFFFPNFKN